MIENTPSVNTDSAQIYTDLSGVRQLQAQSKTDKAGALKNIAHQFESMMVQMMMKSMRDANTVFADGDMTSSSDEKFYQDMFDNQLSLSLSQGRGLGIAEALLRQLQGRGGVAKADVADASNAGEPAVNRNVSTVERVQSLIKSVAATPADNPRITAAIQDTLQQLFGTASAGDTAPEKNIEFDGTRQSFVESLRPLAQRIAAKLGIDSDVLLSQSALETGWGQKVIQCADGSSSFNFFNIKADANWKGAVVKVPTVEYHNGVAVREWASFRAYNSPEESFSDYARLIGENPRYQDALECGDNPRAYVKALADAGYATDPGYTTKILALYDSEHLRASTNTANDKR